MKTGRGKLNTIGFGSIARFLFTFKKLSSNQICSSFERLFILYYLISHKCYRYRDIDVERLRPSPCSKLNFTTAVFHILQRWDPLAKAINLRRITAITCLTTGGRCTFSKVTVTEKHGPHIQFILFEESLFTSLATPFELSGKQII